MYDKGKIIGCIHKTKSTIMYLIYLRVTLNYCKHFKPVLINFKSKKGRLDTSIISSVEKMEY